MRRLIIFVLLIVAIFVIGYVVGDNNSSTKGLTTTTTEFAFSPYIHESFTPLPCSPNTTIGIEGCAEKKVLSFDGTIDSLRLHIVDHLHSRHTQGDFYNAERAWFHYRQTTCKSAADLNAGGTLAPIDFANCLVTLDKQHVVNLTALLKSYSPD